ncbi:hypothetical protein GCM10010249_44820 [Streptomyces roseolilacinus]|uniref:VanZ-like domain-containing protein n=2 Tax=Streptomyces roseolilacinus TaxID=66904 RepID=A0A918B2Z9_9ACTN|nr:hypothetical protein GCM10010249_44820 [Streptomyces roseolilacinus]
MGAVPRLLLFFCVGAMAVSAVTFLAARLLKKPPLLPVLLAVAVTGILSVTLLPSGSGAEVAQCDVGTPRNVLTSSSALLNVALFVPAPFLAVLIWRRPVTTAAVFAVLTGGIEFLQTVIPAGRSCSITDMVANSIGALSGIGLGVVWSRGRRQHFRKPLRDLLSGVAVITAGATLLAVGFNGRVRAVDVVTMDERRQEYADSLDGADQWIGEAAEGLFGPGTVVRQSSVEKDGPHSVITATTDRGNVSGSWPDRTLRWGWTARSKGDPGALDQEQARRVAHTYAVKWLPGFTEGSRVKVRELGDGTDTTAPYQVSYRRYSAGVMMPMRLDLTVTKAGRIMGFTSSDEKDPALPEVTVSAESAKRIATRETGKKAATALLLAQKVRGQWRPVWLIGLDDEDINLDAVTGKEVRPDPVKTPEMKVPLVEDGP